MANKKLKLEETHIRFSEPVSKILKEVISLSPVKISINSYVNTATYEKAQKDLLMLKNLSTESSK